MESSYYTPTKEEIEDFMAWCYMREKEEQEQFLAQIWAEKEQEAFL